MEATYGATALHHPFKPQNPLLLTSAKLSAKAKFQKFKRLSIGSGNFLLGRAVHAFLIKSDSSNEVFQGNNLIVYYEKINEIDDARKLFDEIPKKVFNNIGFKDVQCLIYMILEYGKSGFMEKAFRVFVDMLSSDSEPTDNTFTNLISSCSEKFGIDEGKQLHGLAVKYGVIKVTSLGNAFITMYGKLGWGCSEKAVHTFLELLDHGIYCDPGCLVTVLDGFKNLDLGVQLHAFIVKVGYLCDANIMTALVDMYSKSDNLKSAKRVFDDGNDEDAMVLFRQLRLAGIKPDLVTFSRLLSLSTKQACLVKGKCLHAFTIKTGFESNLTVNNALITMYAKCGSIEDACLFDGMSRRDSVSWNAIVSTYSIHGQGKMALRLFEEMKQEGVAVDEITILAVLQASCYTGLWQDGLCIFNEMESNYGITLSVEHFACMVDLLGRAGRLSEAMNLINNSPFQDSPLLWRTLVNISKLQGDLDYAVLASETLLNLSPEEAGSYILVSNTYAGSGMLDEAAKVRTTMKELKLSKEAGRSWIEIGNKVHCFVANDKDHPESREIYAKLDQLMDEIRWKNCDANDPHLIGEVY
ncbi:Remorin family protein [Hibiscus syriacus]|uniref:Remorin family protein n=1 Tax=Hibiscus syriacus TaxID=106335 RepID=A0A6A2YZV5_HIBSY|nr:Remorin family protein [Hibiscus syriacus]